MIKSEPWVAYFKESVGQPLTFSTTNKPIVIDSKGKNSMGVAQRNNLPIDVISPLEQSNRMAIAQMKRDKSDNVLTPKSHSGRKASKKEPAKKAGRGRTAAAKKSSSRPNSSSSSSSRSSSSPSSPSNNRSKHLKSKKASAKASTQVGNKLATSLGPQKLAKKLTVTGPRAKDIFSKTKE